MKTIQLTKDIEANIDYNCSPAGRFYSCFIGEDEHTADCEGQIGYGEDEVEAVESLCNILGIDAPQFVYIVQAGDDDYHEGGQLIGAFKTKEKANAAKIDYQNQSCGCCNHKYTAYVIEMIVE